MPQYVHFHAHEGQNDSALENKALRPSNYKGKSRKAIVWEKVTKDEGIAKGQVGLG